MKDLLRNKIENKEYISNALFLNIKETTPEIIPSNFDLESHNEEVLEQAYLKYKDYFENMYHGVDNQIHLDKEQIKAILAEEDYSLIIAGAGTGKTTTMVSKVKYLVDIKKVNPASIAVMSFTRKATEELEQRLYIDFDIPASVTTFHSLGMKYIREIFYNRKCYVVDETIQEQIFLDYIKEKIFPNKEKVKELLTIFSKDLIHKNWVFGKYFRENYSKHQNFDDYFESYKKDKIKEIPDLESAIKEIIERDLNQENVYTIKKELVKSKGEGIIANFLFCNNIEYQYEKLYKELMPEKRTYKPDFTLNLGGEEVYLEYFGLSTYQSDQLDRYNKIRIQKENYHKVHHTKFIKLDYEPNQDLIETLKSELLKMGFTLRPKTNEEIMDAILNRNPLSQLYPFKNFLYQLIKMIKSSSKRNDYQQIVANYLSSLPNSEQCLATRQFFYTNDFYLYYQNKLFATSDYGFDFSDMIYYANKYIETVDTNNSLNFEYLIIDEYQDISQERYELTKKIASRNHAKIVAVGDDWQSIYAFTGSKIEYIYNFQKYFKGSKLLKITNTYRNSQSLIDYSGNFIMKNKDQIQKQLISAKKIEHPIRFVMFEEGEEYEVLKKLIVKIHEDNPSHHIMILARNNQMIKDCYNDPLLKDDIGTKIEYVGYEDIKIDGMTIHKSKGLTSDEVILIGLNQNFPHSNMERFWMKTLFQPVSETESIPFAEERRIFYVGLTRTKNHVYLLVNKNPNQRSPFINEIYNIIKEIDSCKKEDRNKQIFN